MTIDKRYKHSQIEQKLARRWEEEEIYHFQLDSNAERYVIDTPPPTVSGRLHIGHLFSYSHPDFLARFWRMNGKSVLYPMGYDDNGLPTGKFVERQTGIRAKDIGRRAFIEKCLELSEEAEVEYELLWKRLGLSVDWRFSYRTIDQNSRRLSQLSFLDLYEKGLAYRKHAPAIWCPECETAIAQAELDDLDRTSEFITLKFLLPDGGLLPIATTRPELLPACVAIFVHPDDQRYQHLIGQQAKVPYFGQLVSILVDGDADPAKGTGAVMCCTFGDAADVAWWYRHELPLVEAIGHDGLMTDAAQEFRGLSSTEARWAIKTTLLDSGLISNVDAVEQSVRVHERCDTPVEYTVNAQWFIKVLDYKRELIDAGSKVGWSPEYMQRRYQQWVENLSWDWCISRQRYYGVTFPIWYCSDCGEIMTADKAALPVDPTEFQPGQPCKCGSIHFDPEEDVMDTWATSSLSPQMVSRWLGESGFDGQSFHPVSLRPQAHEIIRTWAFYSLVKAHHHFGQIPWKEAAISGWALADTGAPKISKSRGGGPMSPADMLERYSADAVRYWAASTGLGKDAVISEDKISAGLKLVNKIWNVARFSSRFISGAPIASVPSDLSSADRWILSQSHQLIARATESMRRNDFAAAKNDVELFFWNILADNYLEMAKQRLYEENHNLRPGAIYTLREVLLIILKLFAPFLPYVTEEIYCELFREPGGPRSIHRSKWPRCREEFINPAADAIGAIIVEIATAVRRYKSSSGLSLGAQIPALLLSGKESAKVSQLLEAESDILSITRAESLIVSREVMEEGLELAEIGTLRVAIQE